MYTKPTLEKYTMDCFFNSIVQRHSSRPALAQVGDSPFTYAELNRRVTDLRHQLRELGIKKQDRVLIVGRSSPNWGIAFIAAMTMGAVAVPVLEEFPETDIDYIINHSEAGAVFISDHHYHNLNLPALQNMRVIFNLDDMSLLSDHDPNVWQQFIKSFEKMPKDKEDECIVEEDDLAEILYTSGTTGHSKGVMLTHKNLVSNVIDGPEVLTMVDETSVVLSILPLAHAYGSTCVFLTALDRGAGVYYLTKKPSPKILLKAMQDVRPTVMAAVPLVFEKIYHKQVLPTITGNVMLKLLLKASINRKLVYRLIGRKIMESLGGRMECAVVGGASFSPEVELFLKEAKIPYALGYGLSETAPLVSVAPVDTPKMGTVGPPIPNVTVKIIDQDPDTGIGEILVHGPNVMLGYYKNEAETTKVFTNDGWLITGDRGYLDDDGWLYITGRSKNVIIGPSGENIYPEAVEAKLKQSPYVEETLVYMADNHLTARIFPDYGYIQSQQSKRRVKMGRTDIDKILEQVRRDVNNYLPPYAKIVKVIEQPAPFVKTATNKIKRAEYVPGYIKTPKPTKTKN